MVRTRIISIHRATSAFPVGPSHHDAIGSSVNVRRRRKREVAHFARARRMGPATLRDDIGPVPPGDGVSRAAQFAECERAAARLRVASAGHRNWRRINSVRRARTSSGRLGAIARRRCCEARRTRDRDEQRRASRRSSRSRRRGVRRTGGRSPLEVMSEVSRRATHQLRLVP
jgi:hypothetical protein